MPDVELPGAPEASALKEQRPEHRLDHIGGLTLPWLGSTRACHACKRVVRADALRALGAGRRRARRRRRAGRGRAAAPAESSAPFTLASIGIKGTLTYKLAVYPETTPNDNRQVHNEGILEVEWARRLTPWAELKVVVDARKDDKDFDEGLNFQIPETSLHRSILDLKEAVARFSRGASGEPGQRLRADSDHAPPHRPGPGPGVAGARTK